MSDSQGYSGEDGKTLRSPADLRGSAWEETRRCVPILPRNSPNRDPDRLRVDGLRLCER